MRVAIAGRGIHVPDGDLAALGIPDVEPACPPERAGELLGPRGLLNKDPATRLALCAVHRALRLPARALRRTGEPDPRVAVVASSNLGNVATVQKVVRAVRAGGVNDVSALDAPNASSNALASAVAIWFGCGGPNLMVCSGATSGLDAVFLGRNLLRTNRADRVIVVGAEPSDPAAADLHARRTAPDRGERLCAAAAAVVLAPASTSPTAPIIEPVQTGMWVAGVLPSQRITPADVTRAIGDSYGALGVLQVAIAAALLEVAPAPADRAIAVMCGDSADGWRWTIVRRRCGADASDSAEGRVA